MLRSDLWVSAFVRRHNDIGNICVVARRGDPIAGQIFIEIDHLNGTVSLLAPAPSTARLAADEDHLFSRTIDHGTPEAVRDRIEREADFDPDFWLIAVELRGDEIGVNIPKT